MAFKPKEATSGRAGQSVTQAGYELFQTALLDGRLRPGQLISQRELVEMLNLSIGALREVLPRLQAEGLVFVLPQRGIQIPAIDLPMVRDAFQMRAALEREAVIHAVREMPEALLHEQRRKHAEILDRVDRDPSDAIFVEGQEVDAGLHALLVRSTRNELILQAYNINSIRIRLIRLDRIRLTRATLPAAFADHIAIIDGILARDRTAAIDAMDRHIANARDRALEL
jgi:DNA-binding GntR family transcriptional regulator